MGVVGVGGIKTGRREKYFSTNLKVGHVNSLKAPRRQIGAVAERIKERGARIPCGPS